MWIKRIKSKIMWNVYIQTLLLFLLLLLLLLLLISGSFFILRNNLLDSSYQTILSTLGIAQVLDLSFLPDSSLCTV